MIILQELINNADEQMYNTIRNAYVETVGIIGSVCPLFVPNVHTIDDRDRLDKWPSFFKSVSVPPSH